MQLSFPADCVDLLDLTQKKNASGVRKTCILRHLPEHSALSDLTAKLQILSKAKSSNRDMIHIEDVTEAPQEQHGPQHAPSTPAAEEAIASEQATASVVHSPETDANVEEAEHDGSDNSEQDVQVSAAAGCWGNNTC